MFSKSAKMLIVNKCTVPGYIAVEVTGVERRSFIGRVVEATGRDTGMSAVPWVSYSPNSLNNKNTSFRGRSRVGRVNINLLHIYVHRKINKRSVSRLWRCNIMKPFKFSLSRDEPSAHSLAAMRVKASLAISSGGASTHSPPRKKLILQVHFFYYNTK